MVDIVVLHSCSELIKFMVWTEYALVKKDLRDWIVHMRLYVNINLIFLYESHWSDKLVELQSLALFNVTCRSHSQKFYYIASNRWFDEVALRSPCLSKEPTTVLKFLSRPLYIPTEIPVKLSILHRLNASRPSSKRLPTEILTKVFAPSGLLSWVLRRRIKVDKTTFKILHWDGFLTATMIHFFPFGDGRIWSQYEKVPNSGDAIHSTRPVHR